MEAAILHLNQSINKTTAFRDEFVQFYKFRIFSMQSNMTSQTHICIDNNASKGILILIY